MAEPVDLTAALTLAAQARDQAEQVAACYPTDHLTASVSALASDVEALVLRLQQVVTERDALRAVLIDIADNYTHTPAPVVWKQHRSRGEKGNGERWCAPCRAVVVLADLPDPSAGCADKEEVIEHP